MNMTKNECLDKLSTLIIEYGQLGIDVGVLLTRNTYTDAERQTLENKCDACHAQIQQLLATLRNMRKM